MKLLVCRECHDVIALSAREERRCWCRLSGGQYREDGLVADVDGPCVALGLHSDDLSRVLWAIRFDIEPIHDIRAWVMPPNAKNVVRRD